MRTKILMATVCFAVCVCLGVDTAPSGLPKTTALAGSDSILVNTGAVAQSTRTINLSNLVNAIQAQPNFTAAAVANQSALDALPGTHVGRTCAQSFHGAVSGTNGAAWFYLPSGAGMVRNIEFTSAFGAFGPTNSTNFEVYVYADQGPVANLRQLATNTAPDVRLPLAVLFGNKIRNWTNSYAWSEDTRYFGLNESYAGGGSGNNFFTMRALWPMPFTNGIAVFLWNKTTSNLESNGYSFVSCESGTLPATLQGYRLRSSYVSGSFGSGVNITNIPAVTGAGELASIYVCFSAIDYGFLEATWRVSSDGNAPTLFGCAGGEDLFNNGYYFNWGQQMFFDYGTTWLYSDLDVAVVSAYRHFSAADTAYWANNATFFWNSAGGNSALLADILSIYYLKPN